MAQIVLGVATSHSPMLSTPPENWSDHALRDHVRPLYDRNGEQQEFDLLLQRNDRRLGVLITNAKMRENFARSEAAIAKLRLEVAAARPDVCVVFGDDQKEMFHADNMPAFSVYGGDRILCKMPDTSNWSPALKLAGWGYFGQEPAYFPSSPKLGLHLVDHFMDSGFDPGYCASQPDGVGMGHAITFLYCRDIFPNSLPTVPIFINTYYPPNQPRISRVVQFGRTVRKAIESFPERCRVAIVASGGLSHFLVDESLDRFALQALSDGNPAALESIPESAFKSGNSEIKNWAAAAGALEPVKMTLIDYIPAYRSLAATGCGLAFGAWHP